MFTKKSSGIILGFVVAIGLVFTGFNTTAQSPTYRFDVASPSNNIYPLQSTTTNMVQWLFTPADFTPTAPTGVFITTIYIRPSPIGTFTGSTFTNLLVRMGNTTLTALTSGPWNTGLTTVLNSASYNMTWNGTPNWIQIQLTTPFLYTGSNFIVEMSQTAYVGGGLNVAQDNVNAGRRMWGAAGSASSSGSGTGQLLFGFDAAPANCSGVPKIPVVTTTPFSTSNPLCAGATTTLTATDPNLPVNGMSYQWQSGPSSTGPWTNVTGGSGANSLVYTTAAVPATTWFRILAICTNSLLSTPSAGFEVVTGAQQPSIISGYSVFCPGDTSTYSVTNIPGTTYSWTLPAGWSGSSTSNSIFVTAGSTAGSISVTATSSCGTSVPRTRSIIPGAAPSTPGAISGNNLVCANSTHTYSIALVPGATSYIWTLPSGWTGSSNSNAINATVGSAGGTITVRAVNGCGSSNSVASLAVSIISSLPNTGPITGIDTVCSGALYTYSIAPVPGATTYTWSYPGGWSGTTTGTSVQAFPGTASGNIQVTASASCATSPVSSKAIYSIATLTPTVALTSTTGVLCQGTPITFNAAYTNGGTSPAFQWQKNGLNVAGFGNIYVDNQLKTGDQVKVTLTSDLRCKSAETVTSNTITTTVTPSVTPGVSINTNPTIAICTGMPITFTTTSTGTGASPSYQWYKNNVLIPGAIGTIYTDAGLKNKDTLTIRLNSNAICATATTVSSNKVGVIVMDTLTPSIGITASATQITPGEVITFTATFSNGGATPTFQWTKNGVDIPFATASVYTSSTLQAGDHISVKMISYLPCAFPLQVRSNEVVMESPVSVGGVKGWLGSLNLYPNPNTGSFTIAADGGSSRTGRIVSVEVLDMVGQRVYQQELTPEKASWQAEIKLPQGLSNGRYMVRLHSEDMRASLPFILNR